MSITRKKIQQAQESFIHIPTSAYAPWDAEATRQRLLTFTQALWSKRSSTSCDARTAAFKGWSCISKDVLECSFCSVVLVHPLDVDNVKNGLEAYYAKQLTEGHAERCPWRNGQCRDDIFNSFIALDREEWHTNGDYSECSFGCSCALVDAPEKYHRWFCPFVYNTNKTKKSL